MSNCEKYGGEARTMPKAFADALGAAGDQGLPNAPEKVYHGGVGVENPGFRFPALGYNAVFPSSWPNTMNDAVIVATARTPIGAAFRGTLNNIKSPTMTAHAIRHAVARPGIEPDEIDDVVIGAVLTAGTAGMNIARLASLVAGLPVSIPAQTVDRQCSSGLMAIASAAAPGTWWLPCASAAVWVLPVCLR